jgi:probable rRNA maturation factor
MRRLNRDFRGKDRVTDVLSFPAPEIFAEAQGWLGELVICAPVLRRQAAAAGGAERGELDLLLVHGLLHLLGLDHERGPAEAREMGEWESRVLGRRGGLVARGSREGLAAKGSRKRFREGTS